MYTLLATTKILTLSQGRIEDFELADRSTSKKNHEISNKHLFSINKLSIKINTQNHCFIIHYKAIIH